MSRSVIEQISNKGSAAFSDGRPADALEEYLLAVSMLRREHDELAPLLYENLGLAYFNLGIYQRASVCFLRASPQEAPREQSLRFVVAALLETGRYAEAARHLRRYEASFGPHPTGLRGASH